MSGNGPKPIVVAMSGGVDSSTAAALLAESHPGGVVGLTMQLWDQRRLEGALPIVHAGRCCSLDDTYDARRVADFLGFPFYVVNFQPQFEAAVVRQFVESYLGGETPIPCTLCNNFIKFDQLLTTAQQIGAERLATGHYARVRYNPWSDRIELRRAADASKDQSYFLFGLTQQQLERIEFPLGERSKSEIRTLARAKNLPVAEKPESQEICFVPTGNYVRFIEAYLAEQGRGLPREKGEIVTTEAQAIGTHTGLHQFTVGQRRGLGVAVGKPLYVVALDRESNRVVVGEESELYRQEVTAAEVNWVSIPPPPEPIRCQVKIRHQHRPTPATVAPANGHAATGVRIRFDQPQRAVTPGQAAVFYQGELLLGGGWIC